MYEYSVVKQNWSQFSGFSFLPHLQIAEGSLSSRAGDVHVQLGPHKAALGLDAHHQFSLKFPTKHEDLLLGVRNWWNRKAGKFFSGSS